MTKIKDIFNFEKGSLQSTKCSPGNYSFITASKDWKTHNEYTHDCEALVFAAAASGSLGRTHYVEGKFIASDLCFIITPKDDKKYPINLKFYHIIFQNLKNDIVNRTKAGTSKEAIGLRSFGNYKMPYFPIEKQTEIAEKFINALDYSNDFSSELSHQLEIIADLRQSFLREAMQGKLVSNETKDGGTGAELLEYIKTGKNSAQLGASLRSSASQLEVPQRATKEQRTAKKFPPIKPDEIPFDIPENWVWCRLEEITINFDKFRKPISKKDRENVEKIYDYYGASGIIDKIDGYTHDGKFLLIGEDGNNLISRSTPLAFIAEGKFWVNNHAHVLKYENDSLLFFMLNWLNTFDIKLYLSGGFQPKFNQANMNRVLVPLPPLEIQNRIVEKLDELMAYCDELEASVRESMETNELLLQQVLREALNPSTSE